MFPGEVFEILSDKSSSQRRQRSNNGTSEEMAANEVSALLTLTMELTDSWWIQIRGRGGGEEGGISTYLGRNKA